MYKLKVITSTVRERRRGPLVGEWVMNQLKGNKDFEVEFLELGSVNLPVSTEPFPPAANKYQHESTIEWANTIGEADAFIIVLAEYNFSFPSPIKNAIDTIAKEWRNKAVGFVTYGGASAGMRSMNAILPVLLANGMTPTPSYAVSFQHFENFMDKTTGKFEPGDHPASQLQKMMVELARLTRMLTEERKRIIAESGS